METDTTVTSDDIRRGLSDLGVRSGDTIMVHSSLSSFGHVNGGAPAVIEGLSRAVGSAGTVVMPAFTLSLRDVRAPVLDVLRSPSEVGAIAETFRVMPGAVRTRHILHSVSARGARAAQVAACRHISSWGDDTPFMKLYDWDAWIVLLGCDYTSCTLLHAVEQAESVSYRYVQKFPDARLVDEDGRESPLYCTTLTRKEGYNNDFTRPGKLLAVEGHETTTVVGSATLRAVRARVLIDTVRDAVRNDPSFLLRQDTQRV